MALSRVARWPSFLWLSSTALQVSTSHPLYPFIRGRHLRRSPALATVNAAAAHVARRSFRRGVFGSGLFHAIQGGRARGDRGAPRESGCPSFTKPGLRLMAAALPQATCTRLQGTQPQARRTPRGHRTETAGRRGLVLPRASRRCRGAPRPPRAHKCPLHGPGGGWTPRPQPRGARDGLRVGDADRPGVGSATP